MNLIHATNVYDSITAGGSVGEESACNSGNHLQCRRPGFDPWVEKIPLEKEMATHSSILAWVIPWTEEPYGL